MARSEGRGRYRTQYVRTSLRTTRPRSHSSGHLARGSNSSCISQIVVVERAALTSEPHLRSDEGELSGRRRQLVLPPLSGELGDRAPWRRLKPPMAPGAHSVRVSCVRTEVENSTRELRKPEPRVFAKRWFDSRPLRGSTG